MSGTKRFCTQCGTQANEGDLFCAACGAKLKSPIRQSDNTGSVSPDPSVRDSSDAASGSSASGGAIPGSTVPDKAIPRSTTSEKASSGSTASGSTVPDKAAPRSTPSVKAPSGSSTSGSTVPTHKIPAQSAPGSTSSVKASSGSSAPAGSVPRPASQSRTASGTGTPDSGNTRIPAPQKEKPKNKAKSFLITLVVIALGWGAGKLLGGGLARDYSRNTNLATKSPIATVVPGAIQTKKRQSVVTKKPQPTATKKPAQTKEPAAKPQNTVQSQQYWDFLAATDTEVRDVMEYYWFGYDSSTGAGCAFFTDKQAKRGGYYWYLPGKVFTYSFIVGTFVDPKANSDVLVDGQGNRVPVTVISNKDGSIDFNFGTHTNIKGTLRLKPGTEHKQQTLDLLLSYKNTVQKIDAVTHK